jgi:anti-sigma-K factor RskA
MELSYNQILDLLPAYALGALEPEEMLAVDAYLNQHQELLIRLRNAEEAAAHLAHAAPPAPLPETAKARLMSRIQADLATPEATPATAETVIRPKPAVPMPPQPSWWSRLRSLFTSPLWAGVSAAALLILLLSLFYIQQLQAQLNGANNQLGQLEDRISELETAKVQLEQANQNLLQQMQTDQARLMLIANADPDRTLQLSNPEGEPGAGGTFYVRDDEGLLVWRGLEPLPQDKNYQLWLIPPAEGAPVPAGLLEIEADTPDWLTVQIPPGAQNFAAVGVSIEPAGGSPAPTGPIVLLGASS